MSLNIKHIYIMILKYKCPIPDDVEFYSPDAMYSELLRALSIALGTQMQVSMEGFVKSL